MAADPILVSADVLVTNRQVLRGIYQDDGIKVLEFKALRVDFANCFLVGHDVAQIKLSHVEVVFRRHGTDLYERNHRERKPPIAVSTEAVSTEAVSTEAVTTGALRRRAGFLPGCHHVSN